jgi:large subunit ribosomal protein L10
MGAAARLFKDFAKDNQKMEVKALALGGQLYAASDIDVIAKLPNHKQALSMLLSVIQAPLSKFGRLMTALKEQKEAA